MIRIDRHTENGQPVVVPIRLALEQQAAYDAYCTGRPVFVHAARGTGKTTLCQYIAASSETLPVLVTHTRSQGIMRAAGYDNALIVDASADMFDADVLRGLAGPPDHLDLLVDDWVFQSVTFADSLLCELGIFRRVLVIGTPVKVLSPPGKMDHAQSLYTDSVVRDDRGWRVFHWPTPMLPHLQALYRDPQKRPLVSGEIDWQAVRDRRGWHGLF